MTALLLALLLGQGPAAPALPDEGPPPPPPVIEDTPEPATPAVHELPPDERPDVAARLVRVERLEDGGFRAYQAGRLVEGSDFFRTVLRPDLAAQADERRFDRVALLAGAAAALGAGPVIGHLVAERGQHDVPPCPPVCDAGSARLRQEDRTLRRRGLVLGVTGGIVTGGLLAWWGLSIEPLVPSTDEAEALARAAADRLRRRPREVGWRLRVAPRPDGALLAVELTTD